MSFFFNISKNLWPQVSELGMCASTGAGDTAVCVVGTIVINFSLLLPVWDPILGNSMSSSVLDTESCERDGRLSHLSVTKLRSSQAGVALSSLLSCGPEKTSCTTVSIEPDSLKTTLISTSSS